MNVDIDLTSTCPTVLPRGTVATTAVPDHQFASDARLVRAAAVGDRAAFAGIYDRYADRLHDFCFGMVRDPDTAADCVQDTFCSAATRLTQLQDPDKLRPWLYAIARNEALRRIRDRRREQPYGQLPDAISHELGPDVLAANNELAGLIAEAANGLTDRDRAVLDLAYRRGLAGTELAEALAITPDNARTLLHRLHGTVERALGALLVARHARTGQGCEVLGAVLDDWHGRFTVLVRKRVARHIDGCDQCGRVRRRLVTPALLSGDESACIAEPAA